MIVLDTNVLSELMRRQPEMAVVDWLDAQPAEAIHITSVTLFETRFGLAALSPDRRSSDLQDRFEDLLRSELAGRVLGFDQQAADCAARLAADRKSSGRPVDMRDTIIAGIVMSHAALLATRNTRHFADLPVPVIDPWQSLKTETGNQA